MYVLLCKNAMKLIMRFLFNIKMHFGIGDQRSLRPEYASVWSDLRLCCPQEPPDECRASGLRKL